MKLLAKSMLRHMRERLLQTILTLVVTILITGMLAVLFHFASSFQHSLRTYALEQYGTYHYKYYTNAGTSTAKLFVEMKKQFEADDWFSDVELIEDENQVSLFLTVRHINFHTTKTMNKKFERAKEAFYKEGPDDVFQLGCDHNYELLASYGDLSKENGIYAYLLVFLALLMMVSAAAILTLGAVFGISAMQREREIALLSGIGAEQGQIIGMMLMESAIYCLLSIPFGYFLGIFVYQRILAHIDNIVYSLFRFPSVTLVISVPYSIALIGFAIGIIMLSGLKSARRVSRITPIEALRHTKEIQVNEKDKKGRSVYDHRVAARIEQWLAGRSYQRYRRRNRPIMIMLAVTVALCFVLNGFKQYALEVMEMEYDTLTYNFQADVYSDEKAETDMLADTLAQLSDNQLVMIKEAVFCLREPYPFSELGTSSLLTNGGILPDISLLCIDGTSFHKICSELGIAEDADGIWGIFLNTDRSWWTDGVKVKGKPFEVATGENIRLYDSMDFYGEAEETLLTIAGIYDKAPMYTETAQSTRMQILVPETVFSIMETKSPYLNADAGTYHISLRGNIEDGSTFEKLAKEQLAAFPEAVCHMSDYSKQIKQETSSIDSFEFLCGALIGIFVFICICGNFTISWAINKTREREFATFLSIGMKPDNLQKMRLFELFHQMLHAFLPGVLAGVGSYQLIYLIYTSEYQISWHFPLTGFILGIAALVISVGTVDLALRVGNGTKSLAEQLRIEE